MEPVTIHVYGLENRYEILRKDFRCVNVDPTFNIMF